MLSRNTSIIPYSNFRVVTARIACLNVIARFAIDSVKPSAGRVIVSVLESSDRSGCTNPHANLVVIDPMFRGYELSSTSVTSGPDPWFENIFINGIPNDKRSFLTRLESQESNGVEPDQ